MTYFFSLSLLLLGELALSVGLTARRARDLASEGRPGGLCAPLERVLWSGDSPPPRPLFLPRVQKPGGNFEVRQATSSKINPIRIEYITTSAVFTCV